MSKKLTPKKQESEEEEEEEEEESEEEEKPAPKKGAAPAKKPDAINEKKKTEMKKSLELKDDVIACYMKVTLEKLQEKAVFFFLSRYLIFLGRKKSRHSKKQSDLVRTMVTIVFALLVTKKKILSDRKRPLRDDECRKKKKSC